jgi:hypothetical protein
MRLRSLALLPLLVAGTVAVVHCGGSTNIQDTRDAALPDSGPPTDGPVADADAGPRPNPDAVGATTSSKVDLLVVVDNSASMGDKARALGASIGTLIRKVAVAGDVHVGVISSSLGTMGGDVCGETGKSNGLAHLSTTGPGDVPVAGAAKGFLSYNAGGLSDVDALVADAQALVSGVGETGCGLEAQLESAYRFLSQPDPWASVKLSPANQAQYIDVDGTLLAQRKAFLRPDSLVVVVMLTDEDDSSADPRAVGGQGWAFEANQFPGSTVFRADGKTTTAPRATSACATNAASADCTSCAFAATCVASDPACQKIKADPECQKNGGYYGPAEDNLNVRFHRMKQRFGIDPQFPISRYVEGFTKQRTPSREGEHTETLRVPGDPSKGADVSAYLGDANCTNPLFAAALPSAPGDELCNLPQGPRGKELVVFAVIGGVPESLAGASPQWTKILGANPAAYDYAGQDVHMLQSTGPRTGLAGPSDTRGDNGTDPVSGREWNTGNDDLQFACTFALPATRTCAATDPSCDCAGPKNPPLCGATLGDQIRGKAYPTIRELRVAKELGDRGIAGSICPTDAALGYVSTMTTLADRLAPRIKN